jgi:hypothetical protein
VHCTSERKNCPVYWRQRQNPMTLKPDETRQNTHFPLVFHSWVWRPKSTEFGGKEMWPNLGALRAEFLRALSLNPKEPNYSSQIQGSMLRRLGGGRRILSVLGLKFNNWNYVIVQSKCYKPGHIRRGQGISGLLLSFHSRKPNLKQ